MTPPDLATDCRVLLSRWRALVIEIESQIVLDRGEGLTRTVEAQECSVLALKGCITTLEEILPS